MKNIAILSGLLMLSSGLWAQNPADIVKRSEEKLRGESSRSTLNIEIVRPSWSRSISATAWSRGSEYSMILIQEPARDRGTVFLKREQEIWNFVPSINRQVKMPPSMMAQSWMGSDFNNDDLVRESSLVVDYTHELKGKKEVNGRECYVIESTPKPEAPVVWGKLLLHISVEDDLQMRVEFYDERDELVQIMEGFDVREMDGRLLPSRMRMTPMDAEGEYTEMTYESLDFDVDFPANFFSVDNMKRVR